MKLKTKDRKILFCGILTILNFAILGSVLIPPDTFWPAVFLAYFIPPVMVLNVLIALCIVIYRRSAKRVIISSLLIFITIPFWSRTYQFPKKHSKWDDSISLLSYNAKLFRKPGVYNQFSSEMINHIVQDSSQIKCIQEFSTNNRWPSLDIKGQIESRGYYSFDYELSGANFGDHSPGMAIFSKYPIIDGGILSKESLGINAIIFADILIEGDTLRIYNVHLPSYRFDAIKTDSDYFQKAMSTIQQIRNVVHLHVEQIEKLLLHASAINYPTIVLGDFNESPYSYTYGLLSRMNNAFESDGSGFGFTMIRPPLYLRIDNIFYNDAIEMHSYKVDYSLQISDHYPMRGLFNFRRK